MIQANSNDYQLHHSFSCFALQLLYFAGFTVVKLDQVDLNRLVSNHKYFLWSFSHDWVGYITSNHYCGKTLWLQLLKVINGFISHIKRGLPRNHMVLPHAFEVGCCYFSVYLSNLSWAKSDFGSLGGNDEGSLSIPRCPNEADRFPLFWILK